MRIALVSFEVAGFRGGGIGTYVVEAGYALTAAGHDVTLITGAPKDGREREALRGHDGFTRVAFVEEAVDKSEEIRFTVARENLRFAYLVQRALEKEIETTQGGRPFDYIEFPDYDATGYVAVLEHRLFGTFADSVVAVVLHSPMHECWQYNEGLHSMEPVVREISLLENETIRQTPVLWAPSTRLAEIVAERLGTPGPGDDGTRIIRYPMRVPEAPTQPIERERPATSLAELRFLYFGRIEPRKGVRQLVEAFRELPELSIECIGADRDSSPIGGSEIAWLQKHGAGNVHFPGALPRAEMLQKLGAADVVILPSTWENWPNTCLEAMSAGRVVIGGQHGGMSEMIEHGVSGFVCDGSDPQDIARVIREDLGSALDRLEAIGTAAHARIRELSQPSRYVAAIEQLVADRRPQQRTASTAEPLVSIVVPFYNEPLDMIAEAVDSAIAQSYANTEILVVNDGSPRPDAAQTLATLEGRDPRLRVLQKANGGLATARNHAIEQARGEFFLFLDADNKLRPTYVADGLQVLGTDDELAAIVPWFRLFGPRPRAGATGAALPFDLSLALIRNCFGDAGAMFRASVFRDHGLRYDPLVDVYSDWALWLDCAGKGLRVQCVPRVLYDYRIREDSMTATQAMERHLHLVGLLIERHLPVSDSETKAMLTMMTQAWGAGALIAAFPGMTRYSAADAAAKLVDKIPGASPVLRAAFARLSAVHGRYKNWRLGR